MTTNLTLKYIGFAALIASVASLGAACGDDDGTSSTSTSSSSSSSGTGGAGTGGTGSGGMADPDLDCDTYCGFIQANCTGDNEQYGNEANCLAVCASFTPGTNGTNAMASGEDTLGCRIYHGNAPAAGDPATHCTHAGPGGDGQCGTNCESFCGLNEAICGFGNAGDNQYADAAACMTACNSMATGDKFNGTNDTTSNANEFSCYLYHLTAAAEDATTHCPHTNTSLMGPCGPAI